MRMDRLFALVRYREFQCDAMLERLWKVDKGF